MMRATEIPSPLVAEGTEGGRQNRSAPVGTTPSALYDAPASESLVLHAGRRPSPTLPPKGGEGRGALPGRFARGRAPTRIALTGFCALAGAYAWAVAERATLQAPKPTPILYDRNGAYFAQIG